jgi:hypothetical protein
VNIPIRWSVHYFFSEDTTPPKDKFVVVAHLYATSFLGLYINSSIPHLHTDARGLQCYAAIQATDYAFLTHDSVIGCAEATEFEFTKISDQTFRGELSPSTVAEIRRVVNQCQLLRVKYWQLIAAD